MFPEKLESNACSEKGSIVNIASMSGMIVNTPQNQCAYNASKGGLIMLTKTMATEWADRGVRVNAICPGYMRTEMSEDRYQRKDPAIRKMVLNDTDGKIWSSR